MRRAVNDHAVARTNRAGARLYRSMNDHVAALETPLQAAQWTHCVTGELALCRLLEPLRQFARDRLLEQGEVAPPTCATRRSFLNYSKGQSKSSSSSVVNLHH